MLTGRIGQQLVEATDVLQRQADKLTIVGDTNEDFATQPVGQRRQFCRKGIGIGKVAFELMPTVFATGKHVFEFGRSHRYSTPNRSLAESLPLQRSFRKASNRRRKSSGVAGAPPCSRACLMSSPLMPIFSNPDRAS